FAADGVFGEATLERYPLPFAQDVGDQLASFDVLDELSRGDSADNRRPVTSLLPGHGELTSGRDRIVELVQRNRQTVLQAAAIVLQACAGAGRGDGATGTNAEDGMNAQNGVNEGNGGGYAVAGIDG